MSLVVSNAGCSFIFVKPPPSPEPGTTSAGPGRCTSSKVAPVVDTLFTGLEGARIVYAATAADSVYSDPKQPLSRGTDIALGVGFAALFLSSAVYGYINTAHCSELRKGPGGTTVNRDDDRAGDWSKPPETTEKWGRDQSAPPPAAAPEPPSASP